MARSIQEIQNEIFANITANENLSSLNSTSKVAVFRLFVFVVSFSIWLLETLFDTHDAEITAKLANQKSGRLSWYKTMALQFQYGFDLETDKDYFVNGDATQEEIEASKIIKYAAVNESATEKRVIIKIAGEVAGLLSPIISEQKEAFEAYIKEIKWAGTDTTVINYLPDRLFLNIQIKRDALVLNGSGMSIKNANYPVNEAIQEFMKELPFDGDLRLSALVDKMQRVPGVIDATLLSAESSWIRPELNGYGTPQPIYISKVAESGYYEVVTFDNISYVV
ncbi:nucleotidyltransferase [Flavobacterium sp. XS1P27]|uniref:nucleotidyltransferase n=1 Tax=Flavobacterium sp. XS1P27 TaxID=3401724 RepID=UPI003AB07770